MVRTGDEEGVRDGEEEVEVDWVTVRSADAEERLDCEK